MFRQPSLRCAEGPFASAKLRRKGTKSVVCFSHILGICNRKCVLRPCSCHRTCVPAGKRPFAVLVCSFRLARPLARPAMQRAGCVRPWNTRRPRRSSLSPSLLGGSRSRSDRRRSDWSGTLTVKNLMSRDCDRRAGGASRKGEPIVMPEYSSAFRGTSKAQVSNSG